jgi:hypothetical protein
MFDGIKKAFEKLFQFLSDLLVWIVEAITAIFKPIIDLFIGIAYFFFKLGVIVVEILQLIGAVSKMALGLAQGIFKTILGLSYDGTPAVLTGSLGSAVTKLQPIFATLQLNKLGYIIIFSIWLFAALAAVKIIQSFRGGN